MNARACGQRRSRHNVEDHSALGRRALLVRGYISSSYSTLAMMTDALSSLRAA